MRSLVRLGLLSLVAITLSVPVAGPATAVTTVVTISGFAFHSANITVAQGTTVKWTNEDGTQHSSDSNMGFWNGPLLGNGQSYSQTQTFKNAGIYGYHCQAHPEMTGNVRVPMKKRGSPGAGWTVRWSGLSSTPANRGFDVQVKRPGSSSFVAFRTNTSSRKAFFNPSQNGTYSFRARTDNHDNGLSSVYSPVMTLSIS